MKRVFAFISLFAISLVMFGFGTANVKAADEPAEGKWVVNPYLLEDENGDVIEIPMYIMDSIRTTFPFHYDYNHTPDGNWAGIARQYAWNGVKTVIPQFDANGATGKYYGVYQQGASKGGETGLGKMIYTTEGLWDNGTFYQDKDKDGAVITEPGGTYNRTAPHDPSLSFSLHNTKDEAVGIQPYKEASDQGFNPFIIFNADGQAVAGLIHVSADAANGLGTEFCYDADGVGVVANEDASNCAKVMVDTEEDDLDKPITDEDGNIIGYEKVQVEGDDPQYITNRFAWAYLGTAPANLNNSYLGEGWKADNWDFYDEETGIAVIIFGSSFDKCATVNSAEIAVDGTIEAGHTRAAYYEISIPAGGFFYQLGYLDRGSTLLPTYKDVEAQAYLYGRNEGYKMYFQCYNYAGSDITFVEGEQNGYGLSKIPGTNTIEAIAGTSIKLADLVDYAALATCFADENDPFSFQSSILSESDLKAKLAEFVEAEKAILREEPAYDVYQEWLDKQAEEEAKLVKAVEDAQAALDAAIAKKEALEDAAEKAILASEDEDVVDEYNALLDAINAAKKAIDDKKDEIVDLEDAVKDIEAELADAETAYKETLQYKGYAQSLSDAYANHVKKLTYLTSFVALGLGCADDLTTTDVTATYAQDAKYENWTVTFANADIEAAKEALVAAIATDDEEAVDAAKEAFIASFQIDETNEFADDYKKVVVEYVDNFEKLEIANTAISSYIATFLSKIGDPTVPTGLYKDLADAKAAVETAKAELGAPESKEDDKVVPSTGLYAELDAAEADRIAYIDQFLAGNTDYQVAKENVATAEAALADAKAKLDAYYEEYKATYNEVENKIKETAELRAQPKYEEWLSYEYANNIALDFTVYVDGARVVAKSEYNTIQDISDAFVADWNAWAEENGKDKITDMPKYGSTWTDEDCVNKFYGVLDWDCSGGTSAPEDTDDVFISANWDKWGWLMQYIYKETGHDAFNPSNLEKGFTSSPGSFRVGLFGFFTGSVERSVDGTWASTIIDWTNKADAWKPISFDEYMLNISGFVNTKTNVTVTVKSPITGMSSSMDLVFVSVDSVYDYTPIIEVNKGALTVNDVKSFDIRSIATAYDKIWSEGNGIKGNDISEQIAFFAPELEAALATNKCGEYEVIMTVTSGSGRKTATASAIVKIVDTIAPTVLVRDVYLNYGDDFHFLDGVYFAADNVDGNLFDLERFLLSSTGEVNTYEPGEYTVEVSAMDLSGNQSKVVEYVVYVNEAPSNQDVLDAIADAETAIKDNDKTLNDETKDEIGKVDTELDGVADDAAGANEGANNNTLAVVVTIIASVAAVASIAAVVLVIIKK